MGDCHEGEGDLERMLLSEDNLPRPGLSPAHCPGIHRGTTNGQELQPGLQRKKERTEEAKEGCSGAVQIIGWPHRELGKSELRWI